MDAVNRKEKEGKEECNHQQSCLIHNTSALNDFVINIILMALKRR